MSNTITRPTVHAVTIERGGYTYLGLWSDTIEHELMELSEDEQAAYCSGRLIPSCRPVRPVRGHPGAGVPLVRLPASASRAPECNNDTGKGCPCGHGAQRSGEPAGCGCGLADNCGCWPEIVHLMDTGGGWGACGAQVPEPILMDERQVTCPACLSLLVGGRP